MGEHNNAMCGYFSRAENCADLWNGIFFQGRQEIKPEELEYSDKEYYAIAKNTGKRNATKKRTSEQRRDILVKKRDCEKGDILLGMEFMDELDYTMPVRKLAYDAQEYQRQMQKVIQQNRAEAAKLAKDEKVSEEVKMTDKPAENKYWRNSGEFLYGLHKEDKLPPLITIALYCGSEKYDGCNDLVDMLNLNYIDTEYGKWISGYPLHVIVLQDLEEEYFQTGLRELIGVMIGNQNLIQFKQEQGGLDMCKAFEMVKEEGRLEGKIEGIIEGKIEGKIEGEERYAKLTRELYIRERMTDILQAATNIEYRNQLYQEFCI